MFSVFLLIWRHQLYLQSSINNQIDKLKPLLTNSIGIPAVLFNNYLVELFSDIGIQVERLHNQSNERIDQHETWMSRYHSPIRIFGWYLIDTDGEPDIKLDYYFNRTFFIKMNLNEFRSFKFFLSQTLQHELIHRYQYQERSDLKGYDPFETAEDSINFESYLSNPDEIDARAHDICLDLTRFGGETFEYCMKNLNHTAKIIHFSESLYDYLTCFDENHPVRKRLLKKVIQYHNHPLCHWKE